MVMRDARVIVLVKRFDVTILEEQGAPASGLADFRPLSSGRWVGWILPEHEGYEGDGDNQHVEQVESAPAEGVFMQDEPVGDDLQDQLDGEDGGEEVVKIIQNLEKKCTSEKYKIVPLFQWMS